MAGRGGDRYRDFDYREDRRRDDKHGGRDRGAKPRLDDRDRERGRDRDRDDRERDASVSRSERRREEMPPPMQSRPSNSLLADLRATALKAQAERRKSETPGDAAGSDSEPGELQAKKKKKITKIVWDAPSSRPSLPSAAGTGPLPSQPRLPVAAPREDREREADTLGAADASPVLIAEQSRWGTAASDAAATAMRELSAFQQLQRQMDQDAPKGGAVVKRDARPALSGSDSDSPIHDTHSAPAPSLAALGAAPAELLDGPDRPSSRIGMVGPPDPRRTTAEEPSKPDASAHGEVPLLSPRSVRRPVNVMACCRNVDEYERLNRIDEGTYGVVFRGKDKRDGRIVALKKIKMEREKDGFPLTSLREINILLAFHHPNIVNVFEVVIGPSESVYMVMEFMEHDLKGLLESMGKTRFFTISQVKCLMRQLFSGVDYLHEMWVLHRDLKTSNILLNNRGELKICDFGLSRQFAAPLKAYTPVVVTLWYRAPELLLGLRKYSTPIDLWSLGCIMGELLLKEPLLPGDKDWDQLDRIFRLLGTPNENIWPGWTQLPYHGKVKWVQQPYSELRNRFPSFCPDGRPALSDAGFNMLNKLLAFDPEKRLTARRALEHPWFQEVPLACEKELMPTYPTRKESAEIAREKRKVRSPDPIVGIESRVGNGSQSRLP